MIRHIFKIIWNERKHNAWLVVEYIIVFCVLWFCCDYLYSMVRNYYSPSGFDINNTYVIKMQEKPALDGENDVVEIDKYALAITFMERVKRYPDIESVAFANAATPYSGNTRMRGYQINADSLKQSFRVRSVSSDFFAVFKMNMRQGNVFDWQDNASEKEVVISPIRGNYFGDKEKGNTLFPISSANTLRYDYAQKNGTYTVIGTTDMIKDSYFQPYFSNIIHPLKKEDVNLSRNEILIRVKPNADKNFVIRFTKDMREQLFIGPYYLSSIISIKDMRTQQSNGWGISDKINSTMAITAFLIVNIFIGILGSFWFRTQTRRSEIGLRAALGSSKRQVRGL